MGQESSDYKSRLVLEICSISTRSVVCVHRLVSNPNTASFIDWYCILGVEEIAGVNTIRKQYHKLALQLHPDKNKHPKAEIAFKLVSEAYACLSDATKRKAFNLERYKSLCFECNRIPHAPCNNVQSNSNSSSFNKPWSSNTSRSRSSRLWRNIRDIRERLREEAKVIENCLQANSMSKKESPIYHPSDYYLHKHSKFGKEIPVFNPSNNLYQEYPHMRNHVYKNSENCRYLQEENDKGGANKYPVFEVKTRRSSLFTRKFVPIPSQC